jgi:DNA replication and repair protein RecF
MILSSINLKNFRSHKEIQLKFSGSLNYIVGGNGQGKTSILEAIYYLCTTRSNSSKSDSEVVSFNENEFEITGSFLTKAGAGSSEAKVFYSLTDNKKFYFQNNKHINRAADIIGNYPVVLLTPADHSITQGSPGDRRKFVDSVISQASGAYLKNLLDYNRTLRHRSSLLASIKESRSRGSLEELDAWSEKLVMTGSELIKSRMKFVNEFDEYISLSYKRIMEDTEVPKIKYIYLPSDSGDEANQNRNTEEIFFESLNRKKEEEIRRGANLVGPHRDDFIFEINSLNLRMFGSQGQHKTFQVVLRFAEFFYLKEITGKAPIFLLDDVFGELDASRSMKISEYLREVGQAFITITDFANFSFLLKTDADSIIKLNRGEAVYA